MSNGDGSFRQGLLGPYHECIDTHIHPGCCLSQPGLCWHSGAVDKVVKSRDWEPGVELLVPLGWESLEPATVVVNLCTECLWTVNCKVAKVVNFVFYTFYHENRCATKGAGCGRLRREMKRHCHKKTKRCQVLNDMVIWLVFFNLFPKMVSYSHS